MTRLKETPAQDYKIEKLLVMLKGLLYSLAQVQWFDPFWPNSRIFKVGFIEENRFRSTLWELCQSYINNI